MAEEVTSIKWHPGFCSAMELEFLQYKDLLDFSREFPLSKEPLRIDLLMIKKIKDVVALSSPSRLIYNVGETVDLTGLSVRIIYEDDTSTDLSYNSDNANLWTVKTNLLKTSDKISDREFVTVKFNGTFIDEKASIGDTNIKFDNPLYNRGYKITIADINDPSNNLSNNVVAHSSVSTQQGNTWYDTDTYRSYLLKSRPIILYKNPGETISSLFDSDKNLSIGYFGINDDNKIIGYPGFKDVYIPDGNLEVGHDKYVDAYYRGKYIKLVYDVRSNSDGNKMYYNAYFGNLNGIEIKVNPDKLDYINGHECFDPTGLVINTLNILKDSNGNEIAGFSKKVFKYEDYADEFSFDVDLTTPLELTNNHVTITFRGKTCILDLNIMESSVDYRYVEFENGYDGTIIATKSIPMGNKITPILNPTREHYDFVKWIIKGTNTEFDFANNIVNDNYILEAVWNPKTYTVMIYKDYNFCQFNVLSRERT